MRRGGVDFREALPPAKAAAMALFLRCLAARRGCGRVDAGRFAREYRAGRRRGGGDLR